MPGIRDQADQLLAILREVAGPVPVPGPVALESILNAWLDDDGRAAGQLRDEGLLDLAALADANATDLVERVPRGLTRGDSVVLRRLAAWLLEQTGGDLETLGDWPTEKLREGLRSIRGLGPTSVDRVLLRAFQRPVFPISRGIYRVAVRHGWLDPTADLEEARSVFESIAQQDPATLALIAQGLEVLAARFCKPAVPRCARCPLGPLLGPDGPRELGG